MISHGKREITLISLPSISLIKESRGTAIPGFPNKRDEKSFFQEEEKF